MAEQFYPFDNQNVTTELQWSRMMRILMTDGVDTLPTGTSLRVSASGTARTVSILAGNAWCRGFYYSSDATQTLALPTNSSTNPRIDMIVLRVNWTANTMGVTYIQGTPAVTPVAPALTKSEASGIFDLPLAQVRMEVNDAITVTDRRRFIGRQSVWCNSDNKPDPEGRPMIAFEMDTGRIIFTQGDGNWQVGLGDTLYRPVFTASADAGTTTASTAWDTTLTDAPSAPSLSTSFIAPPSGRARFIWGAYMSNNKPNGTTYTALRLTDASGTAYWATTNQSGSGSSLVNADADRILILNTPADASGGVGASCSAVSMALNLTPGVRYTATLAYLVNAGSGSTGGWDNRFIDIQPLP